MSAYIVHPGQLPCSGGLIFVATAAFTLVLASAIALLFFSGFRPVQNAANQGFGSLPKKSAGKPLHVFVSHAGEEKWGVVGNIKQKLERDYPDINFFIDETSLTPGGPACAWDTIKQAVSDAIVAVIIISPSFVRKPYPMAELDFFLQRRREALLEKATQHQGKDLTEPVLIPVLYGMSFDEVSRLHSTLYKDEDFWKGYTKPTPTIQTKWASDVKELLTITAIRADQHERWEYKLAAGVVAAVVRQLSTLKKMPLSVHAPRVRLQEDSCVGLEKRVTEIIELLETRGMVLVHGVGGAGKTTLAKAVYKALSQDEFCCLPHYYKSLDSKGLLGIPDVQSHIISTFGGTHHHVSSFEDGSERLRELLTNQKVLLVIDNVWGRALEALLPTRIMSYLGEGSKILVTSRESTCVPAEKFPECYTKSMLLLDGPEATQLFCKLVFAQDSVSPSRPEAQYIPGIISRCGGLPMAVEVVALHLKKEGPRLASWKAVGSRLAEVFSEQWTVDPREPAVADTLFAAFKISYDAMNVQEQKALLLVAFARWRLGPSLSTVVHPALEVLVARGLVKMSEKGSYVCPPHLVGREAYTGVTLHDTVQLFCQEIAAGNLKGLPSEKFGTCSLHYQAGLAILPDPGAADAGATNVLVQRAFFPNEVIRGTSSDHAPADLPLPPLLILHNAPLDWIYLECCGERWTVGTWVPESVGQFDLPRQEHLLVLLLSGYKTHTEVNIQGAVKLRSLSLTNHALPSLCLFAPSGQSHTNLASLDLSCCPNLSQLDTLTTVPHIENLRITHCPSITSIPQLSQLDTLRSLTLMKTQAITSLNSLTSLYSLTSLVLESVDGLKALPSLASLLHLQRLEVGSLPLLCTLPGFESLQCLTLLRLVSLARLQLPESFGLDLNCLQHLHIYHVGQAPCAPDFQGLCSLSTCSITQPTWQALPGITALQQLRELEMVQMRHLEVLPDVSGISGLERFCLDAGYNGNISDIYQHSSNGHCTGNSGEVEERVLRVWEPNMQLPGNLLRFSVEDVAGVLAVAAFGCLTRLQGVTVLRDEGSSELCMPAKDMPVKQVKIWGCQQLTSLRALSRFPSLLSLELKGNQRLECLPDVGLPSSLRNLAVEGCPSLRAIPGLSQLTDLTCLKVRDVGISTPQSLSALKSLKQLAVQQLVVSNFGDQLVHEIGVDRGETQPSTSRPAKQAFRWLSNGSLTVNVKGENLAQVLSFSRERLRVALGARDNDSNVERVMKVFQQAWNICIV